MPIDQLISRADIGNPLEAAQQAISNVADAASGLAGQVSPFWNHIYWYENCIVLARGMDGSVVARRPVLQIRRPGSYSCLSCVPVYQKVLCGIPSQ
jgi:hypothetical protein